MESDRGGRKGGGLEQGTVWGRIKKKETGLRNLPVTREHTNQWATRGNRSPSKNSKTEGEKESRGKQRGIPQKHKTGASLGKVGAPSTGNAEKKKKKKKFKTQ